MTEWLDDAVILRVGHFREADIWLKALARDRGLLTLFAFGAARSKRRFCGCLDVFNTIHCHVSVSRRGEYYTLKEAGLVATPLKMRSRFSNMGVAVNCLRFMEAMRVDADSSGECFAMLEDLRGTLENAENPAIAAFFFRLRAASCLGFAPRLDSCGACGKTFLDDAFFLPEEGQAFCGECLAFLPGQRRGHVQRVSAANLELLWNVCHLPPSGWNLDLNDAGRRACAALIDSFVHYHLGLAWEGNSFRQV